MLLNKAILSFMTFCLALCTAQRARGPELNIQQPLNSITSPGAFAGRSSATDTLLANFPKELLKNIALGSQEFGLDLLERVSAIAESGNRDFMLSPFSIWSLLVLLLEASNGRTNEQLRKALRVKVDENTLRSVYKLWSSYLNVNSPTIEVASLQAIYTDQNLPIQSNFQDILANYNAVQTSVDFKDPNTYARINKETSERTRGLIEHTVAPQDLINAKIFMLSSLYFKGQWKNPFNATLTRPMPFYDEQQNEIAQVPMMYQENFFSYATQIQGLDAFALELPYGVQDRLSMIILLPKRGFTLQHVTGNLKTLGLAPILEKLAQNKINRGDEDVEVLLPKFSTFTDFRMDALLQDMGITDIFDSSDADLSRMSSGLFVNLVVHTTRIVVDEQGTTAGAVTSAVLINKTTPPKFNLNKPFLYLIVEKSTGLLLFAGQVRNPK